MITSSFTALVVDDNPNMVQVASAMLGVLGYKVRTAEQGVDALFYFQRAPCELVLTDYDMPIINGYQLGRKVKSQAPGTRVVIMTGLARALVAGLMEDTGIDGWLFKPFYLEELKVLLAQIGLPIGASEEPARLKTRVSSSAKHNEGRSPWLSRSSISKKEESAR